jgi:hypothetical protein
VNSDDHSGGDGESVSTALGGGGESMSTASREDE